MLLLVLVVGGLLLWFFLTRGDDKTTVPKVVGLQETAATKQLEDKHLKALPNTGPSSQPVGVVFAQKPGAGVQVDKGQTVTISISAGPAHKTVPNVTGLNCKRPASRPASNMLLPLGRKGSLRRRHPSAA